MLAVAYNHTKRPFILAVLICFIFLTVVILSTPGRAGSVTNDASSKSMKSLPKGWLGVSFNRQQQANESKGILVDWVIPESPAEDAGIQRGDRVLAVNKSSVSQANDIVAKISSLQPGSKVQIDLIRDNSSLTLGVTLGDLAPLQNRWAKMAQIEKAANQLIKGNNSDKQEALKNFEEIEGFTKNTFGPGSPYYIRSSQIVTLAHALVAADVFQMKLPNNSSQRFTVADALELHRQSETFHAAVILRDLVPVNMNYDDRKNIKDIDLIIESGHVANIRGNYRLSVKCFKKAFELFDRVGQRNPVLYAKITFYLAKSYICLGQKDKGASLLQRALHLYSTLEQVPVFEKAELFFEAGKLLAQCRDNQRATGLFEKALTTARTAERKNPIEYARFLLKLAEPRIYWEIMGVTRIAKIINQAQKIIAETIGKSSCEYSLALIQMARLATLAVAMPNSPKDLTHPEDQYRQALTHIKKNLGRMDSTYLVAVLNFACFLTSKGRLTEAQLLWIELLEATEKESGVIDPDLFYYIAVNNWKSHIEMGLSLLQEHERLTKSLYGGKSAHLSSNITMRTSICQLIESQCGTEASAIATQKTLEKHVVFTRQVFGTESTYYAGALHAQGRDFLQRQKLKALVILEEADTVVADNGKIDRQQTFNLKNTKAKAYTAFGDYARAAETYLEAANSTSDWSEVWGNDTYLTRYMKNQVCAQLHAAAQLYSIIGEYNNAINICRKLLASERIDVTRRWQIEAILGNFYIELGQYRKAEELLLSVLSEANLNEPLYKESAEEVYQVGSLAVTGKSAQLKLLTATVQSCLADLYLATERPQEALDWYEKAMATLKNGFKVIDSEIGIENIPHFGTNKLYGMAQALESLGKRDKAESLFKKVLDIERDNKNDEVSIIVGGEFLKGSGRNFRMVLINYTLGLAQFYLRGRQYDKAKPLLQEVLKEARGFLGVSGPLYGQAMMTMAQMHAGSGNFKEAFSDIMQSISSVEDFVAKLSLWGTEEVLTAYQRTIDRRYDHLYSILAANFSGYNAEVDAALVKQLGYKGRVLDILAMRQRLSALSKDPDIVERIEELKQVTRQLTQLAMSPPSDMDAANRLALIDELEQKRLALEESVAKSVSRFSPRMTMGKNVTLSSFIDALPEGTAYIDIVRYEKYDYEKQDWSGEDRYLAFVVTQGKDSQGNVQVCDLGAAIEIDNLVDHMRNILQERQKQERGVGGIRHREKIAVSRPLNTEIYGVGEALFNKIFLPIRGRFRNIQKIIVAPSGNLSLIPFELLKDPAKDGYLCDRYQIVYGLGRDLIVAGVASKTNKGSDKNRLISIVANPDFSGKSREFQNTLVVAENKVTPLARGVVGGWPALFDALPGTLEEAETLQKLAKRADVSTNTLTGGQASEASVKALEHPTVLHLATHGFFLANVNKNEDKVNHGVGGGWEENRHFDQKTAQLMNPSIRSGLALAGANRLVEETSIPDGEEDGILTAAEVTGIDLHGTELVVLSACETGLGDIQRGEGVLGLRRSFKIAGTESIIMSLWSVPDEETVWLMKEFYKQYLHGASPSTALNEARNVVRKKLIARDGFDHPYYWAAFILEGNSL